MIAALIAEIVPVMVVSFDDGAPEPLIDDSERPVAVKFTPSMVDELDPVALKLMLQIVAGEEVDAIVSRVAGELVDLRQQPIVVALPRWCG